MTKRKEKTMSDEAQTEVANELPLDTVTTEGNEGGETTETTEVGTTETTETNDDGSKPDDTAETPAHLKNDKRMTELLTSVNKLGQETALGRDSLPKLAHTVVKAAADGIIDATFKDKEGRDAAQLIYAKYAAGESKKSLHEHSKGGKKANESKLRQLIAMGALDGIDPVAMMQDAFEAREGVKADEGTKVKPAYVFYVEVARAQLARPTQQLTREELEDIVTVQAAAPKSLEARLEQIEKLLAGLVTGENRDKVKDASDLTEAAYNAVKERVGQIKRMAAVDALRAHAAKLGLTLA